MTSPESVSLSGMTAGEAREFHKLFVSGFIGFTLVAIVAHFLVWAWKPWIPKDDGTYASLMDGVQTASTAVMPFLG
ncbi:MAG: light-harvesting antenna LH1, beta subunit [Pseudomonadota bacterium]